MVLCCYDDLRKCLHHPLCAYYTQSGAADMSGLFRSEGVQLKCPPPPASIIHTQPFLLLQYIQAISEWESLLLNQIYWSDSPIHLVFYGNLRLFQLCLNLYFDTTIVEGLCLLWAAVQPMDLWLGLLISRTCKTIGFTLQVEWAGPHKVQIVLMLHSNTLLSPHNWKTVKFWGCFVNK